MIFKSRFRVKQILKLLCTLTKTFPSLLNYISSVKSRLLHGVGSNLPITISMKQELHDHEKENMYSCSQTGDLSTKTIHCHIAVHVPGWLLIVRFFINQRPLEIVVSVVDRELHTIVVKESLFCCIN